MVIIALDVSPFPKIASPQFLVISENYADVIFAKGMRNEVFVNHMLAYGFKHGVAYDAFHVKQSFLS